MVLTREIPLQECETPTLWISWLDVASYSIICYLSTNWVIMRGILVISCLLNPNHTPPKIIWSWASQVGIGVGLCFLCVKLYIPVWVSILGKLDLPSTHLKATLCCSNPWRTQTYNRQGSTSTQDDFICVIKIQNQYYIGIYISRMILI